MFASCHVWNTITLDSLGTNSCGVEPVEFCENGVTFWSFGNPGLVSGALRTTKPFSASAEDDREHALIGRILGGERELFYELIAPYERRLYLGARDLLESGAEAEEVAQEALLKGFRNLGQFRGE